jgi:hypothetical protein
MAYTAAAAAFKTFWCREFARQYLWISTLMNQIEKRVGECSMSSPLLGLDEVTFLGSLNECPPGIQRT